MSDSTTDLVSKGEYWMRIAISLHLCVKKALLDILRDRTIITVSGHDNYWIQEIYQPHQIQELSNEHILFHRLCQVYQNRRRDFYDDQWNKIFHYCAATCSSPSPHQHRINSEGLDITCIVAIIAKCTQLPQPEPNWRESPNPNDKSQAVLLSRDLRNEINHCVFEDISTEQKFNDYWQRVKDILMGLQFNDMTSFDCLRTQSLDSKTDLKVTALSDRLNNLNNDANIHIPLIYELIDDTNQRIKSLKTDHSSSNTDLQKQIQSLKASLESLQTQVASEKRKKGKKSFE